MTKHDHKLAVLNALRTFSEPVSLSELMLILGEDYAQRTIRRWLVDFERLGLVEKSGQRRSTRYCLAEKEAIPKSLQPYDDFISATAPNTINNAINRAISYVKKPIFERSPASYDFDWFDAYEPNKTFYLTEAQRTQLQQAGHRNQPPEPAGTYARKIYNRLLIDLSYNSSRLEGNTYSLIETQKLLSEGVSVEGKLDAETVMILNHKEAIRYLVDLSTDLKPDFTEVCTLHYLLSDGLVLNQYAGKVRDQAVRIGGSVFIPLEGQPILEAQLNKVCEKACQIINPYEQSLFLLIHIAYLQAFIDVNKRTSRLSANIPLISQNLVPLSFNDVVNDDYSSAIIALYELKSTQPIAELFCFSYLRTCQQYDATVESMGFDVIRIRYRQQRRELVRQIVVNKVVGDSISDNIRVYSQSHIVSADQGAFEASVIDELKEIAPSRIVGMGFSRSDLQAWLLLSPLA